MPSRQLGLALGKVDIRKSLAVQNDGSMELRAASDHPSVCIGAWAFNQGPPREPCSHSSLPTVSRQHFSSGCHQEMLVVQRKCFERSCAIFEPSAHQQTRGTPLESASDLQGEQTARSARRKMADFAHGFQAEGLLPKCLSAANARR